MIRFSVRISMFCIVPSVRSCACLTPGKLAGECKASVVTKQLTSLDTQTWQSSLGQCHASETNSTLYLTDFSFTKTN